MNWFRTLQDSLSAAGVFGAFSVILLSGGAAHAAITYVDAVVDSGVGTPNTVATDGSAPSAFYEPNGTSSALSGKWARRTSGSTTFGNGANDILQALNSTLAPSTTPELTTTITGLTPGDAYRIYVFFWDAADNQAWSIDAGLASGALTTFQGPDNNLVPDTSSGAAADLSFDSVVVTSSDNRVLLYGDLGTAIADINGEIRVFLDNSTSFETGPARSWYDGVGYEIPEPGSYALLSLGMFLFLNRRRG